MLVDYNTSSEHITASKEEGVAVLHDLFDVVDGLYGSFLSKTVVGIITLRRNVNNSASYISERGYGIDLAYREQNAYR